MSKPASKYDPERQAHQSWLGLLQPVGLVVSPPALLKAQVILDRHVAPLQDTFLHTLSSFPAPADDAPLLLDFLRLASDVLGWDEDDLAGSPANPALDPALTVSLPDYHDALRPTYAVLDPFAPKSEPPPKPLLLVDVLPAGTDLDAPSQTTGWSASPQARLERLLRDTGVPAGLLLNGRELRLVYAPRGESSGHIGFPIAAMTTVSGRPILAALHMLLGKYRVFDAPEGQRLLDLLRESRKYQNEVSNALAEQVLGALWELLRGFQSADEAARGQVLHGLARTDPDHLYGGVLTVIMRLVFLLYAEDRGLMPDDPVYANNYAVSGLYERLREDAGRYPDTMDQRFGAWAWLLSTFRLVYDGASHGGLNLPTRHGQLFNPDEYPFLEGRPAHVLRVLGDTFEAPRVSDGVLWRVLEGLLVLDGERLSYRALDVEQIGSVYESMMGFEVATTAGRAIAVRPKHIVIDVDDLLAEAPAKRSAWLKDHAECDLAAAAVTALKAASTPVEVVAALGRKVSPVTPQLLPPGALYLQPGEERRRSGSHYTPRELTEPIVRTTLRPVLDALGPRPRPDQLLALKVCDPAMGSGAFLVEACRQLADALVTAWELHGETPTLPPDEDPLLHARRLIAQRCLYGVDKNPFAVNLAKLSLWLVTLAKDHAFTFLDHALKHGDSLVGLNRDQLGHFHWAPPNQDWGPLFRGVTTSIADANTWRTSLFGLGDGDYDEKRLAWKQSEDHLDQIRLVADACIAAYFAADKDKDRDRIRLEMRHEVDLWQSGESDGQRLKDRVAALRGGDRPVPAFHWEIEFPEVFGRGNPGFDAVVGNPPFAGKNTIAAGSRPAFLDWLKQVHPGAHGNADLVAHFFRRAFSLLRARGTFGLIATNTIAQGDTRATGLANICIHGGSIYAARKRVKWPGLAAVIVSVVHVTRGEVAGPRTLDEREVPFISAFLFHAGGHTDPAPLKANAGKSFKGSVILGLGFTFDDSNPEATPLAEMHRLIVKDPRNAQRIFPYIGGEEVNSSPTHANHRHVINFAEMSELEARRWPDLIDILKTKVLPQRTLNADNADGRRRKKYWWQWGRYTPSLYESIAGLDRVLVTSQTSKYRLFAFLNNDWAYDQKLIVFPLSTMASFSCLQSRTHEIWADFFGSSMKDDPVYTPSDCFETFPFPEAWTTDPALEAAGQEYYEFRAALMVRNDEGLTKTYNRFHDPNEQAPDIVKLRTLHAAMDAAVLKAYGWTDIDTRCEFLLDYDLDEETLANWGNKKKPYRYRWPESTHDEVLARLLALNQSRHQSEQIQGPAPTPKPPKPKSPKSKSPPRPRAPKPTTQTALSLDPDEEPSL